LINEVQFTAKNHVYSNQNVAATKLLIALFLHAPLQYITVSSKNLFAVTSVRICPFT